LSIPAAHQRLIILPSRHRFTFLVVSRAIEIMLSSDDFGSSIERTATLHPLWQVHMRAVASA
jgi:hypothetical protein